MRRDDDVTDAHNGAACPCCGFGTIAERGGYEICSICWWEDDGQDNEDAHQVRGGPNSDLSLTAARINFLKHGIFDPNRTDLTPGPVDAYERIRVFELDAGGKFVRERATGWTDAV